MIRGVGDFPSQKTNYEGGASFYDWQQFAFIDGVGEMGTIECLAIEKRRVLLFPFALK